MTGIKEVARKAGVSISTVSNVMNEKKPVSPELTARVLKAIGRTGSFWHPMPTAKTFRIANTSALWWKAATAVNHLISLKHSSIAHIAGPLRFQIGNLRLQGYRETMRKAGLTVDEALIEEGDYSPISGCNAMKRLLKKGKHFSAVFAATDQMGVGAIRALLDEGYRVPEDVAVIGIDNNFPSTLITPSLSSVNLPKFDLGYQAMQLLYERMKDPARPRCVITLQSELVVRKSTSGKGSDTWNLVGW